MKYMMLPVIHSFKFTFFLLVTLILPLVIPTATAQAWKIINWKGRVGYIPEDKSLHRDHAEPVYRDQILQDGDIIVTGTNSEVTLKCDKKDLGTVVRSNKMEPVTKYCGNPNPFLGDPTEIRRGGNEPLIPYIISPRYTRLLTKQPTFKWNAVEGATSYTIILYREGLREDTKVWQKSVESTEPVEGVEEFSYPSDEKHLEAGEDYRLVVETSNGRSSQEEKIDLDEYDVESRGVSGLRFRLLGEAQAQSIQEASEEIIQREPLGEEEVIALAFHYTDNNLYAEAIEMLNFLVKSGSQKPDFYRILGDFYAQSGLNLLAEKSYLEAIKQAKEKQEVLEEALALQDLGELYMKMHQPSDGVFLLEQAREQFEEALAKYRDLNRQPKIDEITNLINQLENIEDT